MVACLKFSGTIDRFCGSFQIYLYAYLQVKPLFYLQATYSLKVPYSINVILLIEHIALWVVM